MVTIYYIGGPWDQHKVMKAEPPVTKTLIVREASRAACPSLVGNDEGHFIHFKDHEYYVRKLRDDVLVAVHEDLM